MAITPAQLAKVARDRIGNKMSVSVGEHLVPDTAIISEMNENIYECCRAFGGSTSRIETGFWATRNIPVANPAQPVVTPSESGGTLGPGTYSYRVSALAGNEETLAGPNTTGTIAGSTGSVAVSWTAVPGATAYRVYGRTASYEYLLATGVSGTTWTDTGAITPGSGPPGQNSTSFTSNMWVQDYDVINFIGSDVLEIEEVIRSDAFRSDNYLAGGALVDPRTGIPSGSLGTSIDQGYQGAVIETIQAQDRWRREANYSYESLILNGRLILRVMPRPEQVVYFSVRYISTSASLSTLPDVARVPLENAACASLLSCMLNRTDSDPPEAGQSVRDRRAYLDTLVGQRNYYLGRYRATLTKFLGFANQ